MPCINDFFSPVKCLMATPQQRQQLFGQAGHLVQPFERPVRDGAGHRRGVAAGEHMVVKGADASCLAAGVGGGGALPGGDQHRLSGDRRLACHIHRIRCDDHRLGEAQDAGIDVRLALLRQHRAAGGKIRAQPLDQPVRCPARGHDHQRRLCPGGEARQPVGHAVRHLRRDAVAPVVAADHHRDRGVARGRQPA